MVARRDYQVDDYRVLYSFPPPRRKGPPTSAFVRADLREVGFRQEEALAAGGAAGVVRRTAQKPAERIRQERRVVAVLDAERREHRDVRRDAEPSFAAGARHDRRTRPRLHDRKRRDALRHLLARQGDERTQPVEQRRRDALGERRGRDLLRDELERIAEGAARGVLRDVPLRRDAEASRQLAERQRVAVARAGAVRQHHQRTAAADVRLEDVLERALRPAVRLDAAVGVRLRQDDELRLREVLRLQRRDRRLGVGEPQPVELAEDVRELLDAHRPRAALAGVRTDEHDVRLAAGDGRRLGELRRELVQPRLAQRRHLRQRRRRGARTRQQRDRDVLRGHLHVQLARERADHRRQRPVRILLRQRHGERLVESAPVGEVEHLAVRVAAEDALDERTLRRRGRGDLHLRRRQQALQPVEEPAQLGAGGEDDDAALAEVAPPEIVGEVRRRMPLGRPLERPVRHDGRAARGDVVLEVRIRRRVDARGHRDDEERILRGRHVAAEAPLAEDVGIRPREDERVVVVDVVALVAAERQPGAVVVGEEVGDASAPGAELGQHRPGDGVELRLEPRRVGADPVAVPVPHPVAGQAAHQVLERHEAAHPLVERHALRKLVRRQDVGREAQTVVALAHAVDAPDEHVAATPVEERADVERIVDRPALHRLRIELVPVQPHVALLRDALADELEDAAAVDEVLLARAGDVERAPQPARAAEALVRRADGLVPAARHVDLVPRRVVELRIGPLPRLAPDARVLGDAPLSGAEPAHVVLAHALDVRERRARVAEDVLGVDDRAVGVDAEVALPHQRRGRLGEHARAVPGTPAEVEERRAVVDGEEVDERRDALRDERRVAVVSRRVAAHVDGDRRPGRAPAQRRKLAVHHPRHVVLEEPPPVGVEARRLRAGAVAHEDVLVRVLRGEALLVEVRRLDVVPRRVLHAPDRVRRREVAVLLLRPRAEVAAHAPVRRIRPGLARDLHVGGHRIGLQVIVKRAPVRQGEVEPAVGAGVPAEMVSDMVVDLMELRVLQREPVGLGREGLSPRVGLVRVEEVAEETEPRRLAPPALDGVVGLVPDLDGAVVRPPRVHLHAVVERHRVRTLEPGEPHARVPLLGRRVRVAVAHPEVGTPLLQHHAVLQRHTDGRERPDGGVNRVRLRRQHAKVGYGDKRRDERRSGKRESAIHVDSIQKRRSPHKPSGAPDRVGVGCEQKVSAEAIVRVPPNKQMHINTRATGVSPVAGPAREHWGNGRLARCGPGT